MKRINKFAELDASQIKALRTATPEAGTLVVLRKRRFENEFTSRDGTWANSLLRISRLLNPSLRHPDAASALTDEYQYEPRFNLRGKLENLLTYEQYLRMISALIEGVNRDRKELNKRIEGAKILEAQNTQSEEDDDWIPSYFGEERPVKAPQDNPLRDYLGVEPVEMDNDFSLRLRKQVESEKDVLESIRGYRELFEMLMKTEKLPVATGIAFILYWFEHSSEKVDANPRGFTVENNREYMRNYMKRKREERRTQNRFGEHSKEVTQHIQARLDAEQQVRKLARKIESLRGQLEGFITILNDEARILREYDRDPKSHSESQSLKIKAILKEIDSNTI